MSETTADRVAGERARPYIVDGVEIPTTGKATWQVTAFWDKAIRQHARVGPGDVLDALTLDATVGSLPMKWLKQEWPSVYGEVNQNLLRNRARLRELYGSNVCNQIFRDFGGRLAGGLTGTEDEDDDFELPRCAGDFEAQALRERMRSAGVLPEQIRGGGNGGAQEGASAVIDLTTSTTTGSSADGDVQQPPTLETATERGVMFLERMRQRSQPY